MIETIIKCKLEKDILNYFKNDKNYNYIQDNIQTYINNCIDKDKLSYDYNNYDKQRTYYSRTIYKYDDSICFEEIYLFCKNLELLNTVEIYQNLTQNGKREITKNVLFQYLLNLNYVDFAKIENKEIYN